MSDMLILASVDDIFESAEYPELIREYAEECAIAGMPPVRPDVDLYHAMEEIGVCWTIIAKEGDELVGFATLLVNPVAHYSTTIAVLESFFVAKAHRKSGIGMELRAFAEEVARSRGAVGLFISAPAGGILERIMAGSSEYKRTNAIFFKAL